MPWTAKDAKDFKKGLTPSQAKTWADIANSALISCQKRNGKDCEAYAIKVANSRVGGDKEMKKARTDEAIRKIDIEESIDSVFEGHTLEGNMLKNVVLLGAKSLNGRLYTHKAMESTARLSKGVKTYFDHMTQREWKEQGGVRKIREWWGHDYKGMV